ncbi:MAG: helix-turn-helix transcriptional regulator [Deltaproteobacteria bacterium]|nr:helix-turn-helix transcriptional regulator [Deltaproteobacteria bacterium]
MSNRQERLGLHIRLKRHHLGLTQQELAVRCRISRGHLSQIETGRYRPQCGTLTRLSEILQFDPSAIQ